MAGPVLQVVSGDGQFDTEGVEAFVRANKIDTAGVDYDIVAITGPQSSGKSTLLNHLVRQQAAGGGSAAVAGRRRVRHVRARALSAVMPDNPARPETIGPRAAALQEGPRTHLRHTHY